MRDIRHIAVLAEHFALPSPAQQLLDRFLIGFPQNGEFRRSSVPVSLWAANAVEPGLLEQRKNDFGLIAAPDVAGALREADAVVIAGAAGELWPEPALVRQALQATRKGTPCCIIGLLAANHGTAVELAQLAAARGCRLLAGTDLPFAFQLPEITLPPGADLREALVLVQGEFPAAELDGLEGLLPLLEVRRNGERGVRRMRFLQGDALWRAGDDGEWSKALVTAALSRSHTPQGNAILDGRTEDLAGLGLVPKLARDARGWLLEHRDGVRSALLVLNGVIADVNVAVAVRDGSTISAQLFRPPRPQQEQYSRFAASLLEFFASGREPWPAARSLREVQLIEAMRTPAARGGEWINLL